MLRGDEVGALLGARTSWPAGWHADAVFANSIVSSRLLAAIWPAPRACGTRRR